jgi:hypothetical protein
MESIYRGPFRFRAAATKERARGIAVRQRGRRTDAIDEYASGLHHHHGVLRTVAEPNADETRADIGEIMPPQTLTDTQ